MSNKDTENNNNNFIDQNNRENEIDIREYDMKVLKFFCIASILWFIFVSIIFLSLFIF